MMFARVQMTYVSRQNQFSLARSPISSCSDLFLALQSGFRRIITNKPTTFVASEFRQPQRKGILNKFGFPLWNVHIDARDCSPLVNIPPRAPVSLAIPALLIILAPHLTQLSFFASPSEENCIYICSQLSIQYTDTKNGVREECCRVWRGL